MSAVAPLQSLEARATHKALLIVSGCCFWLLSKEGYWGQSKTWWTFRIFFIFFCLGRRKGESEAPGVGGGGRFLFKIPGGGVLQEGEGPRGPGQCLQRIGDLGGGGG